MASFNIKQFILKQQGFNIGSKNNMFKFALTNSDAVVKIERYLTVQSSHRGMAKAKRYGTRSGRPATAGDTGKLKEVLPDVESHGYYRL